MAPKQPKPNRKVNPVRTLDGGLLSIVVLSTVFGLNRVNLVHNVSSGLEICINVYTTGLAAIIGTFYIAQYMSFGLSNLFPDYFSAAVFCILAIDHWRSSERSCKPILLDIKDIDKILKISDCKFFGKKLRLLVIAWLISTVVIVLSLKIVAFTMGSGSHYAQSFTSSLMVCVQNAQFMFFSYMLGMIQIRLDLLNEHLKKRMVHTEELSSMDGRLAETASRAELSTNDLNEIYVKLYDCSERLQRYMNFPMSLSILFIFITTHLAYFRTSIQPNFIPMNRAFTIALFVAFMPNGTSLMAAASVMCVRTERAAASVLYSLADLLADTRLDTKEQQALRSFHQGCMERRFHYLLYRVLPLDLTLPLKLISLSVTYTAFGIQLFKLLGASKQLH